METLPPSEAFPYQEGVITYNNSDWVAVYLNLRKSWRSWGMLERLVQRMVRTVWDQGAIYKAVLQLVLLYVRKTWVMTGKIIKILMAFHHQVAQRVTGMMAKSGARGE